MSGVASGGSRQILTRVLISKERCEHDIFIYFHSNLEILPGSRNLVTLFESATRLAGHPPFGAPYHLPKEILIMEE